MPFNYAPLNIRVIPRKGGIEVNRFIPYARSRVWGLPKYATQFYKIDNATIQVTRRDRDAWVYIDVSTGSIFYEFFVPAVGQADNPNPIGVFIGIEIVLEPRNDKEVYKGSIADLPNGIEDTWTDDSWSRRDTHYVFYSGIFRIVSSMLTFQPFHNPFSLYYKSPMTNPLLWPVRGGVFTNTANVPASYTELTALRQYNLAGTIGSIRTTALQTVTDPIFGTRTFMIQSDDQGWFYVFPFSADPAAGLTVAELRAQRVTLPPGVSTQPGDSLALFEEVVWKFNSMGARAVATFIRSFDQFDGREMARVVQNDGTIFSNVFEKSAVRPGASYLHLLDVNAIMPHLIEIGLNITLTGSESENFEFDITTEQEYFPDDKFIYGADYAYTHPSLLSKGIEGDDLILLTCEIYDRFDNTVDKQNRQIIVDRPPGNLLAGARFSSLYGAEVIAAFYNLTKNATIKEYPLHTVCHYSSQLDVEQDGSSLYSLTQDYLSRLDQQLNRELEPVLRGYIQAIDLRSCTIAIAYEHFPGPQDLSLIFQSGFVNLYRRYGVVNTHVDKEIFFQSQGVVEVTDRPHEAQTLHKGFKLKHTDDKLIFHQCAMAHFEQRRKADIMAHPDGHVSYSREPEISSFGEWTFDVLAIWNANQGEFILLNHKDIYNAAFEDSRDYADYDGDYSGSFRTWGYFP